MGHIYFELNIYFIFNNTEANQIKKLDSTFNVWFKTIVILIIYINLINVQSLSYNNDPVFTANASI